MTIQEAIKKAIEGGYKSPNIIGTELGYFNGIFLDPQFWQCLGKAMEWGYKDIVDPSDHFSQEEWIDKWHDLIDHLAEGGTAEDYFKQLKV